MAVHYPVEFPFDSAREVVRIFKAGTVATDRADLAEAVWNLQGYAQRMLLGDAHESPNVTIYKATPPATDEEIIEILAAFDKGAVEEAPNHNVPRIHFPFDPQTLLNWCLAIAAKIL